MRYYQWNNLLFIIIGMPAVVVAAYALAFYRPFTHVQQGLWLSFALLVLITVTVTNVQSATRFFAAHPVFYLGLLLLMKRFAIVKVVSLSYYFIGMFLYAVMFPWT